MILIFPSRRSLLVSSSRWATAFQPTATSRARVARNFTKPALCAATASGSHQAAWRRTAFVGIMGLVAMTLDYNNRTSTGVLSLGALSCDHCDCEAIRGSKGVPSSGDVFVVGKITNEPATNIAFPALCNAMSLAGVGVRVKYVFVNVYAVGAYFDPIAMMAIKKGSEAEIEAALLDPTYPRTIRIVMNRGLSVSKFINAIVESVEPRLNGQNLDALEEFKELFPKVDLVEGDVLELTIRGDTLLLKTGLGVGTIRSRPFTAAMCDVYFGKEPVSPTLKSDVLKGVPKL